jgi:hypothetical protein
MIFWRFFALNFLIGSLFSQVSTCIRSTLSILSNVEDNYVHFLRTGHISKTSKTFLIKGSAFFLRIKKIPFFKHKKFSKKIKNSKKFWFYMKEDTKWNVLIYHTYIWKIIRRGMASCWKSARFFCLARFIWPLL